MKRLVLIGALAAASLSMGAVKFPYPQAQPYEHVTNIADVWNCAGQTASTMLLNQFELYLKAYYEESGDKARIKFDESRLTVSEGIGYGMILCVYFSSNKKSYQSQFDKLWNYYKANRNGNGIMNWKISGFGGAEGTGGATDAEEDVAFALAMAYYQFGDSKYKTDAADLIGKMRSSEFSSNGMHKLGDQWDPYKNPSYVSPAAYEVYKLFDSNASFWDQALSTNYNLLLKNRHSSTGIPSGWADNNSYAPIVGNNGYNFAGYDYDAVRAPWRWAWSYAWYGHSQAKDLSEKLATWVNGKPFGQLYINMKPDGTANMNGEPCKSNGCKANGSSIGSLSSVLMVNEKYHDKLNQNYSALMSQQQGYFHSNLRLLTGLLMSGNFPNMSKATPVEPQGDFTVPDSCNAATEYHQNSGAFGWTSTSAVLSHEENTAVYIGEVIQGDKRDVIRKFDGLTSGQKYKFSFTARQTEGSALWMTYGVFADENQGDKYCGQMKKIAFESDTETECEFTAKGSEVYFTLSFNNWDEPQIYINHVSLVGPDGTDVVSSQENPAVEPVEPEPIDAIHNYGKFDAQLGLVVLDNVAYVQLSKKTSARVNVMDMQGRSVLPTVTVETGMAAIPLHSLSQGKYMVVVKQGAQHWIRAVVKN
ncbi:glycosyl hydrolase family 8 [Fibrobacter sp.]|uniref:glycosyl hydrolase family 8 n=1 Tax=Fibrobacter sp. TaxID=35828 RepID=UPI003890A865